MNTLEKINIKNSFTKILLFLLVIGTIIVTGCSCKDDPTPTPPFPEVKEEDIYLTVKQGELSYNISKNDMYINMKNNYGTGVIADWCDDLILRTVSKKDMYKTLFGNNSAFDSYSDVKYWDKVTTEDAKAELDKNMFPDGKEGLTDEEIKNITKEFYDNFAIYGYFTELEVIDYYHKQLSALELAKDYQEMYRGSIDFDNSSYQNHYKGNYYDEFYMILIPFSSMESYYGTLQNLGISIKSGSKENACWIWEDSQTQLSVKEVIDVYIKMYQETNLFKASVTDASKLVKGVDYTLVDGVYQFNTTDKGQLYYSASQSKRLNSDLYNLLSSEFVSYSSESTNEKNDWYWAMGYEFDGTFYTCLMLDRTPKMAYTDARPIIRDVLLANELNSDYAIEIMLLMRQAYGLMIYDQFIQNGYINYYGSGTIPENTVDNGDVVVTFKNTLLTKDDLFELMDQRFGAQTAVELVNYYNALYDKEINDVYDLTKEDPEERILRKERWTFAWETAEMEKADFEAGTYLKYGYPPSYGWENFLEAIYNVRTTQELAYHYLRENCLYDYLVKKYDINNYGESSLLWQSIEKKLNELTSEEHYSVGFLFGIYILDENGERALTSDYSATQTALVKELYEKVLDYLLEDVEKFDERIESIIELYNLTPYSFEDDPSGTGLNLTKYKSKGIMIGFESMGTVSYSDYEGDLYTAIKALYEANPDSSGTAIYGKDGSGYKYVQGSRSYYIYINTSNPTTANVDGRKAPTYAECAEFIDCLINEKESSLTSEQESVVRKHYYQIYMEQIGIYATAVMFYHNQANYEINLKLASYDLSTYHRILSIVTSDCEGQLVYKLN